MFRIGDEVLCVDDDPHDDLQDARSGLDGLKAGEKYHIRWVGQDITRGVVRYVVRLAEIHRDFLEGAHASEEAYYFAFRFKRPIKISKTTARKVPNKLEDA